MLWWANPPVFLSGLVNIERIVELGNEETSIWAVIKLKDIQSAKTFKAVSGIQEIKCKWEIPKVFYS